MRKALVVIAIGLVLASIWWSQSYQAPHRRFLEPTELNLQISIQAAAERYPHDELVVCTSDGWQVEFRGEDVALTDTEYCGDLPVFRQKLFRDIQRVEGDCLRIEDIKSVGLETTRRVVGTAPQRKNCFGTSIP